MTLVAQQVVIAADGGHSRQLSNQEIGSIVKEMERMFGVLDYNTRAFQQYLDRYCQRKGIKPLIITDMYI